MERRHLGKCKGNACEHGSILVSSMIDVKPSECVQEHWSCLIVDLLFVV